MSKLHYLLMAFGKPIGVYPTRWRAEWKRSKLRGPEPQPLKDQPWYGSSIYSQTDYREQLVAWRTKWRIIPVEVHE